MSLNQINNLLKRYVNGNCTPFEARLVENWLAKNWNENDEWKYMDDSSREKWLSGLFDDVQKTILPKERKTFYINRFADSGKWKLVASIAAILMVVCGLYFTWDSLKDSIDPVSYKQIAAASGELKEVLLEDGTHIWLNSGSSLKYPSRFNGKEREVYLQGEAYFEVAHNDNYPFIVNTGELKTRVLGTVFNIRAYKDNPEVKVILFSGKVEVTKTQESDIKNIKGINTLILMPRQIASYQKGGGALVKSTVHNVDQYSAWKNKKLIFDETPMPEVLERLNISYGVNCSFENKKICACTITGSFNIDQKIEEILKSISISIGGKYTKEPGGFKLSGDGCGVVKVL